MTILSRERMIGLPDGATSVEPIPVTVTVANNSDISRGNHGDIQQEQIRILEILGSIRPGMRGVFLPESVATTLGLTISGTSRVIHPDGHTDVWPMAECVWLELCGRHGTFKAVVEPDATVARLGAIMLDELDLLVDIETGIVRPRDPRFVITEVPG